MADKYIDYCCSSTTFNKLINLLQKQTTQT